MPKKKYEATFYYQVTLVREGTIEVDVPDGAADDFNPFEGKTVPDVLKQYESKLGEAEMLVDDETPEGERLMDVLLHEPVSGEVMRATRLDGHPTLVSAPVEMDEDEEETE
jgi:hypothetical protein